MQNARTVLAVALAFLSLAPLVAGRSAGNDGGAGSGGVGSGGGEIGGFTTYYSYGGTESRRSSRWPGIALALTVAAGAATVWVARERRHLAAGALLAAAGLALTPVAFAQSSPTPLTPAADRAIHVGMTEDDVRSIAGPPAGSGDARPIAGGDSLPCLVYERRGDAARLYCFDDGRLAAKL